MACALNAILWIDTDALFSSEHTAPGREFQQILASTKVPLLLSGSYPWRPTDILATRNYFELNLSAPDHQSRIDMWTRLAPEIGQSCIAELAGHYQLNGSEISAAMRIARTRVRHRSNGQTIPVEEELPLACSMVTCKRSTRFAKPLQPKRGPDDLILPTELHRQVMEVVRFCKAWPKVDEKWRFDRIVTGGGGIKALFTGDSGTGKSLAAEVIAGEIGKPGQGVPLLKVDLARIVSKWVGETEKNLEAVFEEAEYSNAVLFFDEADALFGRRGDIQHGTDRYANLEVGYLLQKIEEQRHGLIILASNLKEQIDPALIRRFQVIIHFPRPGETERRRLWHYAFPESAPLDGSIDLDMLQKLDLTGAGIVTSARNAALLAAESDSNCISMAHVIRAVASQYRREARVLSPTLLGPHAALLQEH